MSGTIALMVAWLHFNGSLAKPVDAPSAKPGDARPSVTGILSSPTDIQSDTGVLWKLDITGTLSTGPVKSPLVFK